MITLRRNGDDFPPQAEMYDIVGILGDLQDKPYIEELFRRGAKEECPPRRLVRGGLHVELHNAE